MPRKCDLFRCCIVGRLWNRKQTADIASVRPCGRLYDHSTNGQ